MTMQSEVVRGVIENELANLIEKLTNEKKFANQELAKQKKCPRSEFGAEKNLGI
jgi:hypothetical protein